MEALSLNHSTREQLNAAAEANLVTHMSWVQSRIEGMQVLADEQLTVIDSGLPCDTFNFVSRARLKQDSMRERISQVVAHFSSVSRPFSWWVGPSDRPASLGQALIEAGFEAAESEVAMAADLSALNPTDLAPQGLRIERAATPKQILDFATINAANWSPPDQQVIEFYKAATPTLLAPDSPLWIYVGYLGDQAVATSELTDGGGIVGLYNISTLEKHRRNGIGSALTLRPLLDAREQGFTIAILQASSDGLGVYKRLGFKETGHYTEYQLPKSAV